MREVLDSHPVVRGHDTRLLIISVLPLYDMQGYGHLHLFRWSSTDSRIPSQFFFKNIFNFVVAKTTLLIQLTVAEDTFGDLHQADTIILMHNQC